MPMRSLVTLDETLTTALTSGHLVVPNHRLQRAYTTAFDRHQQSLARHAWHTARVATIERHLIDAFHDAVDTGHAPVRSVLQPEAERWLWRETAPTAVTSNVDGLVDVAVDAWRLVHGWHLEEHLASAARNDAHALFADWSKRFAAALSDLESISSAELPTQLASLASNGGDWLPKHLVTAGFEVVAPAVVGVARTCTTISSSIGNHRHPSMRWCSRILMPRFEPPLRGHARPWRGQSPGTPSQTFASASRSPTSNANMRL